MRNTQLIEKVKKIPPAYQQEVEDFIDFILEKRATKNNLAGERKLGLLKGKLKMSPDFDEPLDDFKDYM